MKQYFHSVTLDRDKCKGCTNCIKRCPTQAIRVQKGKAKIIKERCIDCGECIRVCPYKAKKAVTDSFDSLSRFKYNIAMPAPSFYGQFANASGLDAILTGLKKIGFDDVFEVAVGAEAVTSKTRELFESGELEKPTISSACPAVVRMIAVNFPNLINNVLPVNSPMEIAAQMARRRAVENTGLREDEIGIFFISPCAAKATAVKAPLTLEKSNVDGVISIKDVYLRIVHKMERSGDVESLVLSGFYGICWANIGGETSALGVENYIAVDGIDNVIKVFEDIEDGKLRDIDYVEALACTGGCVGGPLTVENNFAAQTRIKRFAKKLPLVAGKKPDTSSLKMMWEKPLIYHPIMTLDEDMQVAMQKANEMRAIYESLPKLDCGACGAPNCIALAEDIVRGFANETDCIFKLREKVRELAKEMMELEEKMPPSLDKKDNDERENEDDD